MSSLQSNNPPPIAVITGASRGLGSALLSHLKSLKYTIITIQRTTLPSNFSASIRHFSVNLSNLTQVSALISQLHDELPHLDLIINNAAICPSDEIANWREVVRVNFLAAVQLTDGLMPLLYKSPYLSRVINISSGDGELLYFSPPAQAILTSLQGCETTAQALGKVKDLQTLVGKASDDGVIYGEQKAYKLSKACLNGYTRYAARRYGRVAVLAICPGDVRTDMMDEGIAEGLAVEEAVRRMSDVFQVRKKCQSGGFWRWGERIEW